MGKYMLGIWGQKVGLGLGSQRVNKKNIIFYLFIKSIKKVVRELFSHSVGVNKHICRQPGQVIRAYDQYDLCSKPACTILLFPWERYFMALSPAW